MAVEIKGSQDERWSGRDAVDTNGDLWWSMSAPCERAVTQLAVALELMSNVTGSTSTGWVTWTFSGLIVGEELFTRRTRSGKRLSGSTARVK